MSETHMELGAFSISLAVSDLQASRAFYEMLGFERTGGDDQQYLIMVNGVSVIGLFQGLFDKNILTFNPGLAQSKFEQLSDFTDIRELRDRIVEAGVELTADLDPDDTGPASISFLDPDGNPVLIDQFFPRPESDTGSDTGTETGSAE